MACWHPLWHCSVLFIRFFFPRVFSKPIFNLGWEGDGGKREGRRGHISEALFHLGKLKPCLFLPLTESLELCLPSPQCGMCCGWRLPPLPIVAAQSLSLAHTTNGRPATTCLFLVCNRSEPQSSMMLMFFSFSFSPPPLLSLLLFPTMITFSWRYYSLLFFFSLELYFLL